jgi:hypothetical protein
VAAPQQVQQEAQVQRLAHAAERAAAAGSAPLEVPVGSARALRDQEPCGHSARPSLMERKTRTHETRPGPEEGEAAR